MCKTGKCLEKQGVCKGAVNEETCIDHYQCDVGLGCMKSTVWPFASTCQTLRKDGEQCIMDEDCAIDHICWYKTPEKAQSNSKQCISMYSADDFSVFGYVKDPNSDFKYQMHENMKYGRICKSGMVVINESESKMECVQIGNVQTNKDGYASNQDVPYECRVHDGEGNGVDDFNEACKYYYTDAEGNDQFISSEYCECSLMEEKNPEDPQDDASELP